ncbi:hypothetical protein QVD17_28851 [Tagetes erecta]|uniref:Receptor-like serine/threonine-protein kinase n=1 Tax=Tagetes erecta TaxID=13708 RepID=A0AAD8NT44_TARER|nr:hypothetical protein QVD17_28851 [Tagetes erecta]
MRSQKWILLTSCAIFLLGSASAALNAISADQTIKDGETIVSNDQMYELGFFSPGKSTNRYLGIWYKKISTGTVVWVANREKPVTDTSGMLKLNRDGNLLISSGNGTEIWSSDTTVSMSDKMVVVVQLLDTGNLVVWDKSSGKRSVIWQSFDYPGNTWLPGMKIGKNLVTGREWFATSWSSPDDPSRGLYLHSLNINGYPQIFGKQGSLLLWRFGLWNGLKFQGLPMKTPNPFSSLKFIYNKEEIYYEYELNTSVVQRILLMPDDTTMQLLWIDQIKDWAAYSIVASKDRCRYGLCGPYGSCNNNRYPPCKCLVGFRPRVLTEWDRANGSSGCERNKPLDCGSGDGFKKISGVIFPDTQRSGYDKSMNLKECEMACRRNCNCTAFANSDIRNGGSGCLLWFNELIDITEYDETQDLYVKFAASEIADSEPSFDKKKRVITVVLSTSSAVLLMLLAVYTCKKKKRPHMRERGNWYGHSKKSNGVQMEDLDELPFICPRRIAKATDSFSINNKIGEGGFGPVYKGVLEDGQEVAVKRLSETSQQGLDEFMNEIRTIAKLQHRNLVKLLGYCIHGNELIAWRLYKQGRSMELMSASLRGSCIVSEVIRSIQVALLCVQHHAEDRPTMLSVVLMLVSESVLPEPKHPAFYSEESCSELESVSSVDESMITLLYGR